MQDEWRGIESAPTDKVVLVYDEGYIGKGLLEDGKWYDVEIGRRDAIFEPTPTHWMHLPAPPVDGQPGETT